MTRKQALLTLALTLALLLVPAVCFADPLDDAQAKLAAFLARAGAIATGLIPATGGLAVTGLAIKRQVAKVSGEEETMSRAGGQIQDVLKLTAIGTGASLLVSIAGSILK